ncbi:N-glycosylase/DNA lyase [Candidatus Bathyarchaeota archaeon]|nr:N-glycosylase/DNA lyase [Candidatus Bathyarchaeota archaeon]RLG94406.1 MAG: N-glycosylase [Candidatus Bathyarchaeota archaeon]
MADWRLNALSGRDRLIELLEDLKRSEISLLVDRRISEFKRLGRESSREIFKELCFCILCANYSAERSIRIQREIDDGFLTLPPSQLIRRLREMGHRFPRSRASYIIAARRYSDSIKDVISSLNDPREIREWLIRNIRGIGLKEASHFLRNIGYSDLAIIDFHILNLLDRYGIIKKPKTMTKSRYLQIEDELRRLSRDAGLSLAELDLYLWYIETGKILK